ncbi:MAG TPA: PAS domain S-box protein, partial [Planctomycetia bacterium]|nr:PAS domain S-box protein [Planctomycetia bacterium]
MSGPAPSDFAPGSGAAARQNRRGAVATEDSSRGSSSPAELAAENKALNALAEALANEPGATLRRVAEQALELCRCDVAGVSLLDASCNPPTIRNVAIAGDWPSRGGAEWPLGESPCDEVLANDEPLRVANPGRRFRALAAVHPPLQEWLGVPFHGQGRPIGVVWVATRSTDSGSCDENERLLAGLARFAAAAVLSEDRVRARTRDLETANEALRRGETRLRQALEVEMVGVIFFHPSDGAITFANDAFLGMTGHSREDVVSGKLRFDRLMPPEWMPQAMRSFEEFQSLGRTTPNVKEFLRKDGSRRHGLFAARRIGEDEGVKYILDISDLVRAQSDLRESEERFRLMVHTVQDHAIFLMDDEGRVVSWNEGAERILGYSASEALGRSGDLFHTEQDREGGVLAAALVEAARSGMASEENWLVRRDGSRFWASGAISALRDEAGGLRGFAKLFRDMTERRRTEERLRESDERLRVAMNAGEIGTWLWRLAHDDFVMDESLRRLMGLQPGEEVPSLVASLRTVHADDRRRVREEFERCLGDGGDFNVEYRVIRADGAVRWLANQGKVLPGQGEGPPFMAGAAIDITDRKRLENELRDADRRKDEFLAMLGHELRNPLAPLRGVVEKLRRRHPEDVEMKRAHVTMDQQVRHLTRLVDDLLDVSRITGGLIELRREPIDVEEVALQAAEMAKPFLEERGDELAIEFPDEPLLVDGDVTRLTQVVFNLLNNAVKYTDAGGRIELVVGREEDDAFIRVRDNGSGMKPELIPKVFDLFTQGERTLDRSQGGLGLGLTLVKRLVEMHGGRVAAASEGPGKGSEFTVRLPLLPTDLAEAVAAAAAAAPAETSAPPPA